MDLKPESNLYTGQPVTVFPNFNIAIIPHSLLELPSDAMTHVDAMNFVIWVVLGVIQHNAGPRGLNQFI